MTMNNAFQHSSMPFRKKVKIKIYVGLILATLGLITILIMLNGELVVVSHSESFINGFYTGLGGGLIGAGLVTAIKMALLLRNSEKFAREEIINNDERIHFINNKTFALSTFICLFSIFTATIIAGLYNAVVFATLLCVLGFYGVSLLISHLIMKAKY